MSKKTLEELEAEYPGLEIITTWGLGSNARGVYVRGVGYGGAGRRCILPLFPTMVEEDTVAQITEQLALLRKALTPVGEDLEEGEGDGN